MDLAEKFGDVSGLELFLLDDVGVVKHPARGRAYGFISTENGDALYRPRNVFTWKYTGEDTPEMERIEDNLVEGMLVTFQTETNEKGLRAKRVVVWDTDEFRRIKEEIDDRPTYRLQFGEMRDLAHDRLHRGGQWYYGTLWEGRSIPDLRRKFPSRCRYVGIEGVRYPQEAGEQQMQVFPVFRSNDAQISFNVLDSDGETWLSCEDPRVRRGVYV